MTTPASTAALHIDRAGLYLPRWVVVAAAVLFSVISGTVSATWVVAQKTNSDQTTDQVTQLRLCRIERALHIEPWPTCPAQ